MSGTQPSTFYPVNQMLADNAQQIANLYAPQRNQMLLAQGQQQLAENEMDVMGRAAQGLLSLPDEAARAQAYPGVVADLQQQGFAKNAPAQYPGEQVLQQFRAQSLPVTQQFNLGLATSPGLIDQLQRVYGGTSGIQSGTTQPAAVPSYGGNALPKMPPEYDAYFQEAAQRYGIPVDVLKAQAAQESGFNPNAVGQNGEIGIMQIKPSTAANPGFGISGISDPANALKDPRTNIMMGAAYLKARAGNADLSTPAGQATALRAYNGGGDPDYVAHVFARVPATAGVPAPYKVAAIGSVPGPPTTPPAATTAPATTTPDTATAAVPETPTNQVAPGGVNGPPALPPAPVQQPPAQQPPAPTAAAARANLPRAADVPSGMNAPQVRQALAIRQRIAQIQATAAQAPADARLQATAKAMVEQLTAQAQVLMQTDSVVQTQEGQLHTLTGQISDPSKPLPIWQQRPDGTWMDVSGGGATPVTPPSPRLMVAPSGDVIQSKPGGGATVVMPADPSGITTREAAKTLGDATGKDVAAQVPKYMEMGQRADQAINVIDSGIQHLDEAAKAGIPSGYFSPALAQGAAMAKSLGIDLSSLGVKPEAVGDVQTAQKTLGIVAGAILQNVIGKGSQITDDKVQAFIHTQPGLEMDPNALQRILGWARSQFMFEHNMSIDAMKEAATSPTGTLPLNWAPKYFADKGSFGPIYNPLTQQSAQPSGQGPTAEGPPPTAAPKYVEGQTATGEGGKQIIFRGGKWVPK